MFSPILTKFETFRQILHKVSNIKFYENLPSEGWVVPCIRRKEQLRRR